MHKLIVVIPILLLTGCASSMSTLVEEAEQTGDWTPVLKREEAMARFNQQFESACPLGTQQLCVQKAVGSDCRCLGRDRMAERLGFILE